MKKITLPEPAAVKEVHAWRRKIQKKAEKIGWHNYLKELNKRAAHWLEKPDGKVPVVKESPGKKYGAR
jgi:hypothetical protein